GIDRRVESDRRPFDHRLRRTRPLEDLREVAALVADPRPVDLRIVERRHALDAGVARGVERVELPLPLAVPDLDRAAACTPRADRRRGLEIPDARPVEEGARQQRTHGTEIDYVVGVSIFLERAVLRRADERVITALLDAEGV